MAPDPACGRSQRSRDDEVPAVNVGLEDEYLPLLSIKDRQSPMLGGLEAGGSTIASAVFNISTSIVGAGIMALPSKMKVLGWPVGLLVMVAMGVLTDATIKMLIRASLVRHVLSYGDLLRSTNGALGRALLQTCVILQTGGLLIIYLMIIGDVLAGTGQGAAHHTGLLEEWAGGSTWWNSRLVVVVVTVIFILGPLVMLERVDSLQITSALSVLLAIVFVLITIGAASWSLAAGNISFSNLRLWPSFETQDVTWQLFTAIPTMATAYVCHYTIHPVFLELAPPKERKIRTAGKISVGLCTAVYCVTGVFGYLLFGAATTSDVLANFDADLGIPYSKVWATVVRACYAVHLMLVFPVIHFSLRENLNFVLFPKAGPLGSNRLRFLGVTAGIVTLLVVGALTIPSIDVAFEFTGAAASTSLAFTFPALAALGAGLPNRRLAWGVLIFGIFITFTGLIGNLRNLIAGHN